MDSRTQKALENEWKREIAANLAAQIKLENEIKADLIAALKLKQAEIKKERAAITPKKSITEKLSYLMNRPGSGGEYTKDMARLDSEAYKVRSAIKDCTEVTNPKHLPGMNQSDKTATDIITQRQQEAIRDVRDGTRTKEGQANFEAWAKGRDTEAGRAAIAEKEKPLSPEAIEQLAQQRKQLTRDSVEQLIKHESFINDGGRQIIKNIEISHAATEQAKFIQNVAAPTMELAAEKAAERSAAMSQEAAQPQMSAVTAAELTAAVAIDARAETYKEISAEIGTVAVAAEVSREVTQAWAAADAKDFDQINNEALKTTATETIADTAAAVPQYKESLAQVQPEIAAAVVELQAAQQAAIAAAPRYEISDPLRDTTHTHKSLETVQAACEELGSSRYAEISAEGEVTAFVKQDDLWQKEADVIAANTAAMAANAAAQAADLAERFPPAELSAEDAALIKQAQEDYGITPTAPEVTPAEIIPADWDKEPAAEIIPADWDKEPAAAVSAETVAQLEAADAEHDASEIIPADWDKEPAAEIIPADWDKEPAAAVSAETVAQLEAADAEHDAAEIIPADWDKEPAAEIIPADWDKEPVYVADPDTNFESISAADAAKEDRKAADMAAITPADLAAYDALEAQQTAEIIPADWDKDQAANMIEPVTERDLAADQQAPQPVEAASLPQGNEVESDEAFTPRQDKPRTPAPAEALVPQEEKSKPIVPQNISDKYENVDNKFVNKNTKELAFEDQGNKLIVKAKENGEAVAHDLVTIAKARGWDEIKVAGTEEFRRKVWQEAAEQGIKVRGYSPSKSEEAGMQALLEKQAQEKTREQNKENSVEKQRADSFKKDSREDALKKFPELAGAYAAQAAVDKKIQADKLSPEQQAVVRARTHQNIANSIERGEVPAVKMREEVTIKREVSEEREIGR